MASVVPPAPRDLSSHPLAASVSLWSRCFPEHSQREMLQEDLAAGKNVSAVLVSIVTLGLLMMLVTVLLVI